MDQRDPRNNIDHLIAIGDVAMALRNLREFWNQNRSASGGEFIASRYELLREHLRLIPFRVAILRDCCTLEPAIPILRAGAYTYGIDLTTHLGGFNAYRDEMVNQGSPLYHFAPDAVVLFLDIAELVPDLWHEYSDLSSSQRRSAIERTIGIFADSVASLRKNSPASLIIHTAAYPSTPSDGILDVQRQEGQFEAISEINRGLHRVTGGYKGVYLLDYDALVSRYGRLQWRDEPKWWSARLPVSSACMRYLVEEWLRFLVPLSGKAAKVVAVDLDNTLWGGVVGEDGFNGIQIGTEYPGAAYLAVQRTLLHFHRRGILLAVCSKNNAPEAIEVLQKHPGMLLRPEHFASIRINWNDKPQNLREIAAELNVGIDSVAFLDDNPTEREQVREMLPEVTVIDLPTDRARFAQTLRDSPVFERLQLSSEDVQRGSYYSEQRQRAELEHNLSSVEDFYHSLQQEVKISRVDSSTICRVAQLTQKTNQFNLTTRRYTEQQIADLLASPDWELYSLRVVDRFGDNGLVGVAITHQVNGQYEIDVLLLSCRVIGRTVETAFLSYLVSRARKVNARHICGWFFPTPKNAPAQSFYPHNGFQQANKTESGSLWSLDIGHAQIDCPKWIRLTVPEEAR